MSFFKVNVDTAQLNRLLGALTKLEKEAERLSQDMPRKGATEYALTVGNNISRGTFGSFGVPYSQAYEDWKTKKVHHLRHWELFGDLLKSLSAWLLDKHIWKGGIMPGATNREGKLVNMYAGVNESRRPIFAATKIEYESRWKQLTEHSKSKLRQQWK